MTQATIDSSCFRPMRTALVTTAALALLAHLASCSESSTRARRAEGAASDAGARAQDAAAPAPRVPVSRIDAPVPEGEACVATTVVDCDGPEDCEGGQVCCGEYDNPRRQYTRATCRSACELARDQFELCRAGDGCREPGTVCRRSFVLPPFLLICAPPSPAAAAPAEVGHGADAVNCGDGACTGGERCCIPTVFDYETRTDSWPRPYCVAASEDCTCEPPNDGDAAWDDEVSGAQSQEDER